MSCPAQKEVPRFESQTHHSPSVLPESPQHHAPGRIAAGHQHGREYAGHDDARADGRSTDIRFQHRDRPYHRRGRYGARHAAGIYILSAQCRFRPDRRCHGAGVRPSDHPGLLIDRRNCYDHRADDARLCRHRVLPVYPVRHDQRRSARRRRHKIPDESRHPVYVAGVHPSRVYRRSGPGLARMADHPLSAD